MFEQVNMCFSTDTGVYWSDVHMVYL